MADFMLKFFERLLNERSELQRKITELNFFIKTAPNYKKLNEFQKNCFDETIGNHERIP